MNLLRFTTIAVAMAAGINFMSAGENFDSLVDKMMTLNPSLRSDYYATDAEKAALRGAALLPDPQIEGGHQWGNKEAGNKLDVTISQSMDWPGVYSARRREARLQGEALDLTKQAQRKDALDDARLMLVNAVYLKKCRAVMERRIAGIDSLLRLTTSAERQREYTLLDVEKLRIERLDIICQEGDMIALSEECIGKIAAFTGSNEEAQKIFAAATDYPASTLQPLDTYKWNLSTGNPEVKRSQLLEQAANARGDAARRSRLPQLSAGYHYSLENGDQFHGFVAGMSIPIFSSKGKAEAARLESMAAQARVEAETAKSEATLAALHGSALQLMKQYESYRDVLDGSATPRLLLKALAGGQINLMEYLIDSAAHTDAVLRMLEIECRYRTDLARLARYEN